jgi:hypothetical protein
MTCIVTATCDDRGRLAKPTAIPPTKRIVSVQRPQALRYQKLATGYSTSCGHIIFVSLYHRLQAIEQMNDLRRQSYLIALCRTVAVSRADLQFHNSGLASTVGHCLYHYQVTIHRHSQHYVRPHYTARCRAPYTKIPQEIAEWVLDMQEKKNQGRLSPRLRHSTSANLGATV